MKSIITAVIAFTFTQVLSAQTELPLQEAVNAALFSDRGIVRYQQQARSVLELSVAAGQLPDPRLKLGMNNLPMDTFDLDQEPMTQISLGFSQQFPAGSTRALRREVAEMGSAAIQQRADLRRMEVVHATRLQWYDLYYWQQALRLYKADQALYEQLLSITHSLFSVGKKQQQDVLRAELEISRLQERLIISRENRNAVQAELSRWVGDRALGAQLPKLLPTLAQIKFNGDKASDISRQLNGHPRLRQLRKEVQRSKSLIRLAEQQYQPNVGIDLSYGYRDGENVDGSERADFASLMISIDMPLFTEKRQDRQVAAQVALYGSEQARYDDALREQVAEVLAQRSRWQQLCDRRQWFEDDVLKKSKAQAQATLNAYQSDTADFSELMRAYISDQKTQLDYQRLRVDEQKALAELHFLAGTPVIESGVQP